MKAIGRISYATALAVLLVMAYSPSAARADYFTGKWSFSGLLGHPTIEELAGVCEIAVNHHGDVAGSCKGPYGVAKADGETNGYNIVLRVHHLGTRPGGVTGVATLKGMWHHNGVITGVFTDSPFPGEHGDFIGRPVH
jgi:hypothetical protein